MQRINLPPRVRVAIYIATALVTPIIGVLTDQKFLPDWVMTLWTAEVAAVGAMAAINVSEPK
jgi:hypothetical protein